MSEAEKEAIARAIAHNDGYMEPMDRHYEEAKGIVAALDRVRDARGDDDEREDHKAKLEAIGAYLEQYPPSGFTDRYSAGGWSDIARGVLSAASVFGVSPSRDGSVAVEDVTRWIVNLAEQGYLADWVRKDFEREFFSASTGDQEENDERRP